MGAYLAGAFLLGCALASFIVWRFGRRVVEKIVVIESDIEKSIAHLKDDALKVVTQVEEKYANEAGEFRRAQGLRMLLNITNAAERDCALALEWAVRKKDTLVVNLERPVRPSRN